MGFADDETRSPGPFARLWRAYVERGYSVIPILPFGVVGAGAAKRPCNVGRGEAPGANWQTLRDKPITDSEVELTLRNFPGAGIGVMPGYNDLVVVDVDTLDPTLKAIVKDYLPAAPLRLGHRKKLGALYYRADPANRPSDARFVDVRGDVAPGGVTTILEVFATRGQTVAPPSIHVSGDPYVWQNHTDWGGDGDLPPPVHNLPLLRDLRLDELRRFLELQGYVKELRQEPRTGASGGAPGEPPRPEDMRALLRFLTKQGAFLNRDDWRDCGMALRLAYGDNLGYDLWQEAWWAAGQKEPEKQWRSFDSEYDGSSKQVTFRSLVSLGRQQGFDFSREAPMFFVPNDFVEKPDPGAYVASDGEVYEGFAPAFDAQGGPSLPEGLWIDNNDPIVAPQMLVKNVLPFTGVAIIYGQSGAGKTFIAVNLALSLTTETPFFGCKTRERVGVLILAAEGGATDLEMRVRAARLEAGYDDPLPIVAMTKVPNVRNPGEKQYLIDVAKHVDAYMQHNFGIRLGAIILDTVSAGVPMEDENSNAEIKIVVGLLRDVSETTGALMVPVHHMGKDETKGMRGGSAWEANSDVALASLTNKNGRTGERSDYQFWVTKNRFGRSGYKLASYEMKSRVLGLDEDDEVFGTLVAVPKVAAPAEEKQENKARNAAVYQILEKLNNANGSGGISKDDFTPTFVREFNISRSTFYRARDFLYAQKWIVENAGIVSTTPAGAKEAEKYRQRRRHGAKA